MSRSFLLLAALSLPLCGCSTVYSRIYSPAKSYYKAPAEKKATTKEEADKLLGPGATQEGGMPPGTPPGELPPAPPGPLPGAEPPAADPLNMQPAAEPVPGATPPAPPPL
jgi:hypothetical protein